MYVQIEESNVSTLDSAYLRTSSPLSFLRDRRAGFVRALSFAPHLRIEAHLEPTSSSFSLFLFLPVNSDTVGDNRQVLF